MALTPVLLVMCLVLNAADAGRRNSRGLVATSSLFGRVKSLEGELEGELDGKLHAVLETKPKEATGDEADYENGDVPTYDSSKPLVRSEQELPGSKHWWRNNPVLLQQVLEESGAAYELSVKMRDEHGPLRKFLRNKGMPNHNKLFLDGLLIPTFQCPAEYRLGSWVDGGKWVCLSHNRQPQNAQPKSLPVVLSIGCRGETSFEEALFKELGANSHAVDFSLSKQTADDVRSLEYIANLYEVGLCGSKDMDWYTNNYPEVKWVTVFDLLGMIGAKYVDIFKIDCERCEYGVVRDLAERYTREDVPFGQIQMELHLPGDNLPKTFETLKALEDLGYRIFHSEINRFSDKSPLYHYEIAYVHESLVKPLL